MTLLILFLALALFAAYVLFATKLVTANLLPAAARRWAWLPVAAIVAVVPFSDELYNEQRTRAACAAEGGLQVDRVVRARFAEAAAASIETRRVDREEGAYWRHELIYVYKPTGEELGRLRWFRRKYGWLQGNVPGTAHAHYFKAEDCPDPQRYLAGGRSRMELVRQLEGD